MCNCWVADSLGRHTPAHRVILGSSVHVPCQSLQQCVNVSPLIAGYRHRPLPTLGPGRRQWMDFPAAKASVDRRVQRGIYRLNQRMDRLVRDPTLVQLVRLMRDRQQAGQYQRRRRHATAMCPGRRNSQSRPGNCKRERCRLFPSIGDGKAMQLASSSCGNDSNVTPKAR